VSDPDAPGPLIGSGRSADIYDIGDGKVLRRFRSGDDDLDIEMRVMQLVAEHGFPVPAVFSVDGRDMVMSRVDGPTMLDDLGKRPMSLLAHARQLAKLQRRLADISAPEWLMAPGWVPDPTGDRVLHLDLHPMNVLLSSDGPVVIDWTNAAAGPAGFDAAVSSVILSAYEADSTRDRAGQKVIVEAFRRFRGRTLIDAFLGPACDHRLADVNLTPGERVAVGELRKRSRS
jgi:aminoglycoside phosphotransferase (APT) family kinase protein